LTTGALLSAAGFGATGRLASTGADSGAAAAGFGITGGATAIGEAAPGALAVFSTTAAAFFSVGRCSAATFGPTGAETADFAGGATTLTGLAAATAAGGAAFVAITDAGTVVARTSAFFCAAVGRARLVFTSGWRTEAIAAFLTRTSVLAAFGALRARLAAADRFSRDFETCTLAASDLVAFVILPLDAAFRLVALFFDAAAATFRETTFSAVADFCADLTRLDVFPRLVGRRSRRAAALTESFFSAAPRDVVFLVLLFRLVVLTCFLLPFADGITRYSSFAPLWRRG
jgi:hypothetical protein